MRLITNILILSMATAFLYSCAHKSGQHVFKNGQWQFESSNVGIMHFYNQRSGVDVGAVGMFIWPLPSSKKVSSFYGHRKYGHHDGIDIKAYRGAHILAVADGVVKFSGNMRGYGKIVILDHKNGYHSVYAHNNKNYVKKGSRVSQGEVVGLVGSTGRSTGPHLHFEIRKNNKNYNPLAYYPDLRKKIAKN